MASERAHVMAEVEEEEEVALVMLNVMMELGVTELKLVILVQEPV